MMGPGFADELARGIGCSLLAAGSVVFSVGLIIGFWIAA